MKKQINLTENEIKDLVTESVHTYLNEAGLTDKLRNWYNRIKNKRAKTSTTNDNNTNGSYSFSQQPSQTITPNGTNMDRWNEMNANNASEDKYNDYNNNAIVGNYTEPQQQQAPDSTGAQQETTPQYQRGAKYKVTFSRENEKMFNNNIVPTYNNLNNVIKSLGGLRQIGEFNYNQASSIFNTWGQNNFNGGQQAFKAVCQQIDSIMPTLQNLKTELKNVLKANGVRDTEDYQHFNMEEQKIKKIISNSLQKILDESKNNL